MGTKLIDTVSSAQSVIPAWYTNAAMDLLAQQKAVTDRAYTPYGGARISGFTPDQLASFDQVRQAATGYRPQLAAAGKGALAAATTAKGIVSAATPALQGALGYATASTNPYGLQMASPWLSAAGDNVADVSDYMNPYSDEVVAHLGELGARTLRDQLAPAINDKFIQAGQLRSSGQSVDEARALRDVYGDTLAKQAELLQQGYTQAQAAKGSDLSRFAGLAGTAGNLGLAQQGALSTAAGQFAGVGSTLGGLTQAQSQAQLAAAQQQAALAQQQQQQQLTGATAMQQVGGLQQAQQQKSLDQQYQDFLAQQNFPQQQIDNATKTFQGVASGVPQGSVGYEQQLKSGQGASAASTLLAGLATAKGVGVI